MEKLVSVHGEDLPDVESLDALEAEIQQWMTRWKSVGGSTDLLPDSPHACLRDESIKSGMFPNIAMVLRLIATVPVTTCECERSVSDLRRLKSYLRSTMSQDRLSSLALMHIHYGHKVDADRVVSLFAAKYPRRMGLVNILSDE